jgi:hypothetical protein
VLPAGSTAPNAAAPPTEDAPTTGNTQWFVELENTPRIGPDVQLDGAGVVQYTEEAYGKRPVLIDPIRVVQQGHVIVKKLPDGTTTNGCEFLDRRTEGRQTTVSKVEVAYDPKTCKSLVEFGETTADLGESDPAKALDSGSSAAAPASPGAFNLEVPDYKAKTRSQVREPAYPALPATTEVNAEVEVWNQQPQYAPSVARWWTSWLTGSGWYRTYHDEWHGWSANNIYEGESSDYQNDLFCMPWSTYASHNTQTVGFANLTVSHTTGTSKSGGCSDLLRTDQTDNFWWINTK